MENKPAIIFNKHPQWTDVKKICLKLKENGFTAWLAGGCVRDGLLGVMPKDFDVATNARPKKIETLFNKTVDVGKAFGVIRVIEPSGDIEVATFRKDGPYVDGRHPVSVELSTPEEDAKRRDFTINALFYDPFEEKIHDFVEGLTDLQAKVIRTVGIAADRFMEDKLRVLRAVRFVSQLDFDLDDLTFKAVCHHAASIGQVSVERIADEISKLFSGIKPDKGISLLHQTGLLQLIFPEIQFENGRENFFKKTVGLNQQELLGWMALFRMIPDSSQHQKVCKRLKFSTEKTLTLSDALEIGTSFQIFDSLSLAEKKKRSAEPQAELALKFLEIEGKSSKELAEFVNSNKKLPPRFIEAADLLALGIKPGKELGRILEQVYDAQLDNQVQNRGEALQWVQKIIHPGSSEKK